MHLPNTCLCVSEYVRRFDGKDKPDGCFATEGSATAEKNRTVSSLDDGCFQVHTDRRADEVKVQSPLIQLCFWTEKVKSFVHW